VQEKDRAWWRRAATLGGLLFLVAAGLSIVLNHQSGPIALVPHPFRDPARALVVLAIGSMVSLILERYVFRTGIPGLPARQVTVFRFLSRLVLYVAVVLSIVAAFGASVTSVLFGSAFLTVMLGLAGQSMLSNILAGVWLVVFHPFDVGDRIEFMTWQYPVVMPSFPHEVMVPTHSGTVVDVNLMYTTVAFDSGLRYAVPNGILVQAAVANRSRLDRRRLRIRVDVKFAHAPAEVLDGVRDRLRRVLPHPLVDSLEVLVGDIGPDTYGLVIHVTHNDHSDDQLKSRILAEVAEVLTEREVG
jgi:small-conductance mechanosensitive channel